LIFKVLTVLKYKKDWMQCLSQIGAGVVGIIITFETMTAGYATTDEELVALLTGGDAAAFRLLYDRYWKRMLAKAYTQLGSHADAEEVVQDTFINLWNRRERLQLKYTFTTYIAAAMRYEIMARIARNKIRLHLSLDDVTVKPIADDATRQWLDFEDLLAEIESAVQALPEKCQLVFRLSREQGLTEKQIAEHLSISPKTVEAHMSKALKSLRSALKNAPIFFLL
jgi:RNA polymerase sigma-70 factor (family 1)